MITQEQFNNNCISITAWQLHVMTGCGQDAAENFINETGINAQKLIRHLQQNIKIDPALQFITKHYITETKGTVGGVTELRDKFINSFR